MDKTPRTFCYVRWSTDQQKNSEAVQRDKIERYVASAGLPPIAGWFVDAATSGKLSFSERPAGREAISVLSSGDVLVAAAMDRMGRNAIDLFETIAYLVRLGAVAHVLDLKPTPVVDPSDPVSMLMLSVMACVAQFERQLISSRTRETAALRKKLGLPHGQPPPGYVLVGKKGVDQRIEICPHEGPQVVLILELQKRGVPIRRLFRLLQAGEIRRRDGSAWGRCMLFKLRKYYGETPDKIPACPPTPSPPIEAWRASLPKRSKHRRLPHGPFRSAGIPTTYRED